MSLNTKRAGSREEAGYAQDSIATIGRSDASSGNFESSGEAGSVSINESAQTGVGEDVSKEDHPNPAQTQLTKDEIERRAYQGFEKLPNKQDCYDLWRYHSPAVRNRILRKAEQAEKAGAHAEGKSFEQDPHTVPTADKTSIRTDTSSSYSGSSVSSQSVKIKREIKEETVPYQLRRNKGSTHSATPLGLATSAPPKRHSNSKVVKREPRTRRRRFNDSGKDLRETRIKQERTTRIKQEGEDDAAVSLGREVAPSYKKIADEASFPHEASDALPVEKKVANQKELLTHLVTGAIFSS